jgi:hypothetical protein
VERLFGRINSGGETPISNDKVISVTAEDTVTGKPAIIVTASEAPVIADMSEWFIFEYIEEELEELEETAALPETIMRSRSQSTDDLERAVQSVAGGSANEQQQQQPLVERLYHQRKQEEQARIKRISIDPSRFDLSKTELKRQRAIYELIMTERAFVKDMQILCNVSIEFKDMIIST